MTIRNLFVSRTATCIGLLHVMSVPAIAAEPASGFLAHYDQPGSATLDPSVSLYRKTDLDLRAYDKLLLDDFAFSYADDSTYKDFSVDERQRIVAAARESLQKAVGGKFEIVTQPAPGVLRVRAALTDIRAAKKSKNLLSFTPVGLIKQGVDAATGMDVVLRTVTAEAELSDALSGERLLAIADRGAGQQGDSSKASWSEVRNTLDGWAQQLARQLDAMPLQQ